MRGSSTIHPGDKYRLTLSLPFTGIDRVVPIFVGLPTVAWTLLTIALFFVAPAPIATWQIATVFILQSIGWVTSFVIDVPIQISLSKNGWSEEKVARLILTDRLLRQLPSAVAALLFVWMMLQVLTSVAAT